MKIRNRTGPRIMPWGTPALTEKGDERIMLKATTLVMRVEEVSKSHVELVLESIGGQLGEQGRMPNCIKSRRYVQRWP